MTRSLPMLVITVIIAAALAGCATVPEPASARGKPDLRTQADSVLAEAQRNDPSLAALLQNAAGHAVFPTIGSDSRAGGKTYNEGVLYEYGTVVGDVLIRQASDGLRESGHAYAEIIVFQTEMAVYAFKHGDFAFDPAATAVAIQPGAAANTAYAGGVAVFTVDHSGKRYEAPVGGQRFSYQAAWPTGRSPSIMLAGISDP